MKFRQCNLNDCFRHHKKNQWIDQHPATILKFSGCDDRRYRKIQNCPKIHDDIYVKMRTTWINIIHTHGEYHSIWNRNQQKHKICDLTTHCNSDLASESCLSVQYLYKTDRHRRRQAKPQIIRHNIQPSVSGRQAIHNHCYDLQHWNSCDHKIGQKKATLLFFAKRFTQICEYAHKA